MNTGAESWQDYLDPGERLLWTGAPVTGLRFRYKRPGTPPLWFAMFFLGFSVFWIAGVIGSGGSAPPGEDGGSSAAGHFAFALFGLPFLGVGVYMTFGHYWYDAWIRARTRYALTDRRALIARNGLRRELKSWPISPDTAIDYLPGDPASIRFATETTRDSEGGVVQTRTGFEMIPDGATVYSLVRDVQTGRQALPDGRKP
jgi:hypothetical protein